MSTVKRRLVYVADENDELLADLSDSPPTRKTRFSKLQVTPSDGGSPRMSARAAPDVDPSLLVSWNGFVLADGSGQLRTPTSTEEATALLASLRECVKFIKKHVDSDFLESSDSSSSSSSSEDEESGSEEGYDDDDDREDDFPKRRKPRTRAAPRAPKSGPHTATVKELRDQLRDKGLSVLGRKEVLEKRLHDYLEQSTNTDPHPPSPRRSVAGGSGRFSAPSSSNSLHSQGSSHFGSPLSRSSTQSRGIWTTLVDAGTRLFRKSHGDCISTADQKDASRGSLKRRRST